jgi:hypothetical protein
MKRIAHAKLEELATLARSVDKWWRAFEAKLPDIESHLDVYGDLRSWMNENLQAIDERLAEWEFGAGPEGLSLILSAGWDRELVPLVEYIVAGAPKIQNWKFLSERPAESQIDEYFQARVGLSPESFRFELEMSGHNTIAVSCWWPERGPADDKETLATAMTATVACLGEALYHRWVGHVTVVPPSGLLRRVWQRPPKGWLRVADMRENFVALVDEILATLPPVPLSDWDPQAGQETRTGYVYRVKHRPQFRNDYPRRTDLCTMSMDSHIVPMFMALMAPHDFQSARFSRFGEIFCYLKIARDGWQIEDRHPLHEAVDAALRAAHLGCVISAGMGVRYCYLELVVSDGARAMDVLREVIERVAGRRRGWLLFADAELRDEWIGLSPDGPEPPNELS